MIVRSSFILALCLAVACSGDRSAPGDSSSAATQSGAARSTGDDLADVTAYRLDMDKIDRWLAANRNGAVAMASLSPAEKRAIAEQEDRDEDQSLDGMARQIEANPHMAKAVRDAGLSPREYALISMSVVQSGMAAAVLQMRPNDNQDSLVREMKANIDNVRFMRENEAVIRQKREKMEAELKAAGIDPDAQDDDEDHSEH